MSGSGCFSYNDTDTFRQIDTGSTGNLLHRLPNQSPVYFSFREEYIQQTLFLSGSNKISPMCSKGLEHSFAIGYRISEKLFSGTDNTIIKSTSGNHLFSCCLQIDITIKDHLYITGTYTERGFSRRVSGFHHRHPSCGNNDIAGFHQFFGLIDRRFVDHLDQIGRNPERSHNVLDQIYSQSRASF